MIRFRHVNVIKTRKTGPVWRGSFGLVHLNAGFPGDRQVVLKLRSIRIVRAECQTSPLPCIRARSNSYACTPMMLASTTCSGAPHPAQERDLLLHLSAVQARAGVLGRSAATRTSSRLR